MKGNGNKYPDMKTHIEKNILFMTSIKGKEQTYTDIKIGKELYWVDDIVEDILTLHRKDKSGNQSGGK